VIYLSYPNKVPVFITCRTCSGKGRFYFGTGVFASAVLCPRCTAGKHVKYLTRGRSLPPLIKQSPKPMLERLGLPSISRCLSALNN